MLKFFRRFLPTQTAPPSQTARRNARLTLEALDERIVPNAAPVALNMSTTIQAGTVAGFEPSFYDPDGDTVNIVGFATPNHGTVAWDGAIINYTPDQGFVGTDQFAYTITDGNGGYDSGWITVAVVSGTGNSSPFAPDVWSTVHRTDSLVLEIPYYDPDGDPAVITEVYSLTGSGATITIVGNTIVYYASSEFTGDDTLEYTVTDLEYGGTTTATITLEVTNHPPETEDLHVTVRAGRTLYIYLPFVDPDGPDETITLVDLGTPQHGIVSGGSDAEIVYRPNMTFTGTDSFSYSLEDGEGARSGGTITVNVVNSAPVAGTHSFATVRGVGVNGNLLSGASDGDGDTLTASPVTLITANGGSVVIQTNGLFTYTTGLIFLGTDNFTITLSDGYGGTTVGTVSVVVTDEYGNLTEPPTAQNIEIGVSEEEIINVLTGAYNLDPSGGAISLHSVNYQGTELLLGSESVLRTEHGMIWLGVDGLPRYAVTDGIWEGAELFTYRIVNALGSISAPKTVTMMVTAPVPKAPPLLLIDFSELATATNQSGDNVVPFGVIIRLRCIAGESTFDEVLISDGMKTAKETAEYFQSKAQSPWEFSVDNQGKLSVKGTAQNAIDGYKAEAYTLSPFGAPITNEKQPDTKTDGYPKAPKKITD